MADVAIIPHLKSEQTDNSSPNKLYEYMYLMKPIVASNCNSVKRIVEEGQSGIIYQHESPRDLADKLTSM